MIDYPTYLTKRPTVPALEELMFVETPVLDLGYVTVVDYKGNDTSILNAARTSYEESSTKKLSNDKVLLRYLMRHHHASPFEMPVLELQIKLPIFVERQFVRHRTHSMNEVSARYSILDIGDHQPASLRLQDTANKQGSSNAIMEPDLERSLLNKMRASVQNSRKTYNDMIANNVAREQARNVLPVATYTKKVWQMNLRNLLAFSLLRLDFHAQQEIREYAKVIAKAIEAWVPLTFKAFTDYGLEAKSFSRNEMLLLKRMLKDKDARSFIDTLDADESIEELDEMTDREINEFIAKLGN